MNDLPALDGHDLVVVAPNRTAVTCGALDLTVEPRTAVLDIRKALGHDDAAGSPEVSGLDDDVADCVGWCHMNIIARTSPDVNMHLA